MILNCVTRWGHTKRHKLHVILFGLGNIPPKHRSTLKAINLVACATHPVVAEHGLDAIVQPFVEDLNKLSSQGITINIDGTQRTFKGALLCILGLTILPSTLLVVSRNLFLWLLDFAALVWLPIIRTEINLTQLLLKDEMIQIMKVIVHKVH